ncbi:3-hydroxyacyl-CoA dehydrogenase NAD-binding domain-containing protein [Maricurvus nonylphenolicus]|uniref:3-hydroxyacyl-CoA dehydrogenase NAD-binding domain-containing protein n=1 Tax=Maricurvus nonylphenolicus TaxID=1008307 RepID=UPI0036F276DC
MSVLYRTVDQVAVITLDLAPVNSLGLALRKAIRDAYESATADENIKAIVINSSQKVFCAGADITEFGTEQSFADPSLPSLCDLIEASAKPVVAAINGMALGGGLELALAADYRVAKTGAKLGLPEVNLGIIPGAGGTQRLPRLANVNVALDMITSGVPINTDKAVEAGLLDKVYGVETDEEFETVAIEYASTLADLNAPVLSCENLEVAADSYSDDTFSAYKAKIAKKTAGYYAPNRCVDSVEAATQLPLKEGLQREAEIFQDCADTPQARAQQHLFFAERAAGVIPGVDRKVPLRDIKKVAVIGAGTMGGGIAMNFANAGIPVTLLEIKKEFLDNGLAKVRQNYEISAKRGRLTEAQVEERMALFTGTTSYADLADVDLVIEAVFENLDVKKEVFTELDKVCKPGCILASNTSTLDVNEIAEATSRPEDVLGLHFFSPANVMKLLEVIRADKTADDALMTTLKLAKTIKKVPVVVGVCYGFVGNRMVAPYSREAFRVILEGATPEQSDLALTNFGMAMGAVSMGDMAGIDIGCMAAEANRETWEDDKTYQALQFNLKDLGRLGQKTGRGVYIYEGRDKHNDPEVLELAKAIATENNIEQRDVSEQEIVDRAILMLANEGAKILDEGIAYRSGDIDLVYIYGYGFPAYRGGPMQYADELGLDEVVKRLKHYQQSLGEYGERWFKPAPLLERLAAEGKPFKDFQKM